MIVEELFDRCLEIATSAATSASNRQMHEVLVVACAEGTKGTGQGFGNVFSQVDFLCKRHGIAIGDRVAIQTMRRHSNRTEVLSQQDLLYDVRALCLFLSAVFSVGIPSRLVRVIPTENRPTEQALHINHDYIRCIVRQWDSHSILADTNDGEIVVNYDHQERGTDLSYLHKLLREGMQLNLLDCHVDGNSVSPRLVVVEPDFLIDVSSIARCFNGYGNHPLLYTVERLKPRSNSYAVLLGKFAGTALDEAVKSYGTVKADEQETLRRSLRRSFQEQALQFCTCEHFNGTQFTDDARRQVRNIFEAVDVLFGSPSSASSRFLIHETLLEPSFVCEQLGLQGRVDLMTRDLRLLVEQKSGKNYQLERLAKGMSSAASNLQKEEHYVQLLLYYGILRYNFGRSTDKTDIRLLYSRYPAHSGLLYINFYQQLFREAIKLRNQIVATEFFMAREGFGRVLPLLSPAVVYKEARKDSFYYQYIEPEVSALTSLFSALTPLERAYFERMMTFVYCEQLRQKVGTQEGQGGAVADLWNMPLNEKQETGNIFVGLTVISQAKTSEQGGFDLLTLSSPRLSESVPNFRRGDMVYLYQYAEGEETKNEKESTPDVRRSILYKGTLQAITSHELTVRLTDGQQNADAFSRGTWAVEHAGSDMNTNSNIKSLYQFASSAPDKRNLLLGQREPRRNQALQLSKSFHPHYDDVLLRQKQASDYFLLVGPPGTGKTSMALRFIVEEELLAATSGSAASSQSSPAQLLLLSYTNRAVDEICAMLCAAGHPFVRLGNESSCDPAFKSYLLDAAIDGSARLDDIRQKILQTPIVVGTTSTIQARPWLFSLKHFSLAVVDEASQILEPNLVGLLSSDRIDRFVLIGDYKQLPAVVQQDEATSRVVDPLLLGIGLTDCRQSLFERLIRWEHHCRRTAFIGILHKQGRMHPDIADFPNRMFYQEERLEPVPCEHQLDTALGYDQPSDDRLDDLLKQHRMLFIPSKNCREPRLSEKVNTDEARIVADLLRRIWRFYGSRFDSRRTVGVIVPYRNQIAMIRNEVERLAIPALNDISIDTVERYQGSQRDVIIYSFTVQSLYQLSFLTSNCFEEHGRVIDRKLNVAITRARKQMLMTGNVAILSQNPLFHELIKEYTFT